MPTVEVPPAPAADAVTFRLRRSRLWLGSAIVTLPTILVVRGAIMVAAAVAGAPPDFSDYVEAVGVAILTAVAGAVGATIGARNQPGWVRSSSAGLEFASSRCTPAFLPWSQVRSVAFRWRGPYTEMVITPVDIAAVGVVRGPGRAPRTRRRKGESAFVVDAGVMAPGPAVMAAELNRRMQSPVGGSPHPARIPRAG